ncbi:uncharacterized protein LOC123678722 [Harmonia axyridis]|uniref:uncharacterized protein LOC123678722 n=1 Tax=Harmonia axyridis TaxID=115357 RepID=UPI001E2787DA|nr:uncharacterized protein LOC123678722 [Harmonia axyridis]
MERHHLTLEEMNRVVGLLEGGMRQVDAAERMGVSQSVISRLWRRFRTTGNPAENHPGRGRCTTAIQDRFLVLTARRQPTITAPELDMEFQRAHNLTIGRDTVRNRLHEADLHSRRPIRCPPLSRGNRAARLNWCREFQNWGVNEWSTILFTDESRFGYHPDSRRIRLWRRSGNLERLRHVQEVHRYRGGTIMVWGGISIGRRTELVFPDGFLRAQQYLENILQPIVQPYAEAVGENFHLMHDNARPHTARIVTQWLDNEGIDVLQWPTQSPDLNPIEHVWNMLQRRITPNMGNVQNVLEFRELLTAEWTNLNQEDLNNLILSMNRRCRAKGSATLGAALDLVEAVIKNMESGRHVVDLFADLQKAFDTVDHKKLLEKLYNMGARGPAIDLT